MQVLAPMTGLSLARVSNRQPGPVNTMFANANGVRKPPIKARDDAQTFVWARRQRRVAAFSPHSLRVAIKKALRGVAKP